MNKYFVLLFLTAKIMKYQIYKPRASQNTHALEHCSTEFKKFILPMSSLVPNPHFHRHHFFQPFALEKMAAVEVWAGNETRPYLWKVQYTVCRTLNSPRMQCIKYGSTCRYTYNLVPCSVSCSSHCLSVATVIMFMHKYPNIHTC